MNPTHKLLLILSDQGFGIQETLTTDHSSVGMSRILTTFQTLAPAYTLYNTLTEFSPTLFDQWLVLHDFPVWRDLSPMGNAQFFPIALAETTIE